MTDPFKQTPNTLGIDPNPIDLAELPIELITLSDNFIESLTAPIHPTPPSIDRLHQLFQDFYELASTNISVYLQAQTGDKKLTSVSGDNSNAAFSLTRHLTSQSNSYASTKNDSKDNDVTAQQMLTPGELSAKRSARKQLETKKLRLEEAVEQRINEGIYEKIYRHRSTNDAIADDKLRSRTAALAVVGINLSDLGLSLGKIAEDADGANTKLQNEIRDWLEPARNYLIQMHESRYPLGKINHLKNAHRAIVETLAHFHPSSSADEILPMLIFTLITMEPTNLNIVSDLHFIQNFRWEARLTGEAAYCLTNLEAAIGFLETVDLSTLRDNELPSGSSRSGASSPDTTVRSPALIPGLLVTSETSPQTTTTTATAIKSRPVSGSSAPTASASSSLLAGLSRQNGTRTLSDLSNTPAVAMGVASEIFTTADQGLKNISTTLGESYKFFVSRLREPSIPGRGITVPKTLDEARKLINASPEDTIVASSASFVNGDEKPRLAISCRTSTLEERLKNVIDGEKSGTRSVSGSSNPDVSKGHGLGTSPGNTAVLDSVRNFGSSLNPMARLSSVGSIGGSIGASIGGSIGSIGNIGSFRGFGRSAAPLSHSTDATTHEGSKEAALADGSNLSTAFPDLALSLSPREHTKLAPPVKRFMEIQNPGDIQLSEVEYLLKDYKRLAHALEERKAFSL